MKEKYGTRVLRWGIVEAPVVFNDRVIFTPGGDKATFVAFNLNTGKVVWESKTSDETSAYCSPLLYTYKNKTYLTTSLSKNLVGIDVNTGKLVWQTPQVSQRSIHPNTPLYKEGRIYSLVGYGKGGIMVKLSDDGQSASELWTNTSLDNHIGGAVWIDNYIVSSGHQNDRSWQCLDANTGKVLYKNNELGQGAVVYADGLFYCYADNGEMGIMEIGADGLKLKSKFRITLGTDQHWAHPVIHEGVMYIRHGNTLMAYKVKK
jgi:outer membrane protein assembly factor BamB